MKTMTMSPAIRALSSVAAVFATLPVSRWLSVMAERRRLAALDPRLLQDIGVDASAQQAELSRPFWDVTSLR
ncbi:MAG: hypothetical protein AAFQ88_12700 [Pseudomonadota bacterium]